MASKEPEIITDKNQMRKWSRAMRSQGKTIGLVPTMGFLHDGHLSLIREAHGHTDLVVVSIYVNPGQFSPSEDLSTYPSDFDGDIQKLRAVPGGVDVVFHPHNLYDYGTTNHPSVNNVNGERDAGVVSCLEQGGGLGHETWVKVERLEKGMCGKSRPVFFRGVATVVTKLFNVVDPDVAVFGKKDYQQLRIVQRMVRDLDFAIEVIGSEIVRESDGLAMSSRNVRLSPDEREQAASVSRSLSRAKIAAEKGRVNCRELRDSVVKAIEEAGGRVDYAEIVEQESLVAVEEITSPIVFCVAAWFGKELPRGKWFCCPDCCRIHSILQKLLVSEAEKLPDSLLDDMKKKHEEKGLDIANGFDVRWRLISGKIASPDSRVLLSKAVSIFHECFDPIIDSQSGRDLIPAMVYGRNVRGQEFGGMYCAILMVNSTVVSAGIIRVFGRDFAELPLVATSKSNHGKGYFQLLFSCIEKLLAFLNVQSLVLPAAEEAESIWTEKFGFTKIRPDQLINYRKICYQMVTFKGTSMLQKKVPECRVVPTLS